MQDQLNQMQQTQVQMQNQMQQMQNQMQQMQNQQNQIHNQMQQMQNQQNQMQQTQVQMQEQMAQNQVQIQTQLAQVQAQLQPLPGLVTQLIESVTVIEARSNANGARLFNSQITLSEDALYVPVVKYTPGHPFPLDELVHLPRVQFTHIVYPVNSEPPANLMPRNSRQLEGWRSADNVDTMRQRLLSIYWFYNDSRLALDDDADENVCFRLFKTVDSFLRIP
ncbi:hypothetical protein ABFS82_14G118400 [Erythranthe guttata]